MAFSTSPIAFCTILSSKDGMEMGLSFPFSLGDVDPAQRLSPVLALFEPPMKLLDILRGALFVHLVGDAVHSCTGFLSEPPESRIQRLGRDQMSDRKELSLRILLGPFGYSVDLCGHTLSKSEPRLCFLSSDTCICSPLPSSGFRGRSFRKPCGFPLSQVHMGS